MRGVEDVREGREGCAVRDEQVGEMCERGSGKRGGRCERRHRGEHGEKNIVLDDRLRRGGAYLIFFVCGAAGDGGELVLVRSSVEQRRRAAGCCR